MGYKLDFYTYLIEMLDQVQHDNKSIILTGDFNIAHKEIDLARPKDNKKNTGFTIEEREKIDNLTNVNMIDSFRMFNQKGENYTWWSNFRNARGRNIGWRIDYFFISKNMKNKIKKSYILPKVLGSDHCPIVLEF